MNIQTIGVNNGGKSTRKFCVPQDITLFQKLDEARTNFIANILHELKTPVSSIKMCLQLLKDSRIGNMNSQQLKLLNYINDDSERLLKFASELLDHTQIATGRMLLTPVPASPGAIVAYAVSGVKFPTAQKRVDIQVKAPTGLPGVLADKEKTAWVLVNFLLNALRYSSGKKIVIHLYQENERVNFSVQDFGKGIEERYRECLFERHFQIPADGCKTGSGLGLAISKEIIDAQHGEVWVESVRGEGSTFSFSLPVHWHDMH
jgi:NtrC-family two-component system sensor histidine kinase KinB